MSALPVLVPPPPGALRLLLQDAQTFFITIAVLLGAGILSLPVKLVDCGLWPFLAIFTLTLGMQLTIVYVSCDLVEIAKQSLPRSDLHTIGKRYLSPLLSLVFDVLVLITFLSTLVSYALAGSKAFVDLAQLVTPAASSNSAAVITPFVWACTLGIVFLEGVIKPIIAVGTGAKVILLCFIIGIVGMVSSEVGLHPHSSWADLLQPFLVGTVAIGGIGNMAPAFYDSYLLRPPAASAPATPSAEPTTSSAVMVVATPVHGAAAVSVASAGTQGKDGDACTAAAAVAASAAAEISRAFYAKARRHFRSSMIAGIVTCYALNLLWAWFVLGIVPQTDSDAASYVPPFPTSLQSAARNGDPATIPVNRIIDDRYPQYAWVASTVKVFITLSIIVSYNAVGLGLKHVLDGMAATGFRALAHRCHVSAAAVRDAVHFWGGGGHGHSQGHGHGHGHSQAHERRSCGSALARALGCGHCGASLAQLRTNGAARGMVASRAAFYAAIFGAVWGLALANPQGFVTVLEVFTSLTLNSSGGVFIVVMYLAATLPKSLGGAGAPHLPALPLGLEPSGAAAALAADAAAAASTASAAAAAAFDDVRTPLLTAERAAADAGFRAGTDAAPAATAGASAASSDADALAGVVALTQAPAPATRAAAGARARSGSKGSKGSDASGESDEDASAGLAGLPPVDRVPLRPRVLGLSPSGGRMLSHFALITFLLACWYDPFNTALGKVSAANGDESNPTSAGYAGAALALGAAIVLFWGWAVRPFAASLLWLDAGCWPSACRVHAPADAHAAPEASVSASASASAEGGMASAIVRAGSTGSTGADAAHLHLSVSAGTLASLPRHGSVPGIALGDMHAHPQTQAEGGGKAAAAGAVNAGAGLELGLDRRATVRSSSEAASPASASGSGSLLQRCSRWFMSVLRSRRLDEPTAPLILCAAGVLLHAQEGPGASVIALAVAGAGVAVAAHLLASIGAATVAPDGLVFAARLVDTGAAAAVAAAAFTSASPSSPVATAVGVVVAVYAAIRAAMGIAVLRSSSSDSNSNADETSGSKYASASASDVLGHGAGSPVASASAPHRK